MLLKIGLKVTLAKFTYVKGKTGLFSLSHIYLSSLLYTYPDIFKYGGCFRKRLLKHTLPYLAHSNRFRPSSRKGQNDGNKTAYIGGHGPYDV